ncbi:hypothetical protein [Apilactobacillus timberlakei]|uniref:hypothetical protein n=1 Tax=Apilactobacillus timberlakei TaxID=2008380 RepID=UPI00112D30C4|nr:hypothetical protein [Apilactobacillus timberlakei]TPR17774.1 hypothetical protein DYZ95_04385 [Apilactobacillus timberlakei]TPR18464.1 hypothetical protein DY138_05110 [Apilactobacillus timberlakei]TPR20311.1 hypothetical protein DY061_05020 [Apilactobacillus timberlakei]TPR22074.1 hypothetical protein DY083_05010 [Apilactobacillus timberlakei]TPR22724.1 hypothetical protein DY102_05350 [Apilactobacillus timberlakei]
MKAKIYTIMPIITILYSITISLYLGIKSISAFLISLIIVVPYAFKAYKKEKNAKNEEEKSKILKEMKKNFYLDIIIIIILPIFYIAINML